MYINLNFNQQEMLCRLNHPFSWKDDTSPIQVANKNMTCPSHCTRQYLIALKDTTSRRKSEANDEMFDLGILGLSDKGVKVNKNRSKIARCRAVGGSENPGVPVVIRWAKSVPPG